jgi:hypothetical protein
MKTERKIYAAVAVLALLGSELYFSRENEQKRSAMESSSPELPKITLAKGDAEKITKLELTTPDDDDKSKSHTLTLDKQGDDWEVTSPVRAAASTAKVQALLDNLKELRLKDAIDRGTGLYDEFDVTGTKALHVVAWKGEEKASDLYFGKSGTRGQSVRVVGVDGVFAMANSRSEGFAGFLYTRNVRGWRETSILTFDAGNVVRVEIANKNGSFSFMKSGDRWSGSFAKRNVHGELDAPEPTWTRFDGSKVEDLIRNYKSLSADDFGEEQDRAGSGVDEAEETGGIVHIRLKDNGGDRTIRVGKLSKRASRWAIKDSRWAIKEGGDGTLYVLSPWTADWATADAKRFEGPRDVVDQAKSAEAGYRQL